MTNRNNLILNNISLVKKLARIKKRNLYGNINIDELVSAGNFGLVKAADKFDESKGTEFRSYAVIRIMGEMNDYVKELGWGAKKQYIKAFRIEESQAYFCDSFEMEFFDGVFEPLTDYGKQMMRWHFVDNLNLKQIGQRLHITESRVSQLLSNFINKVREFWMGREHELYALI